MFNKFLKFAICINMVCFSLCFDICEAYATSMSGCLKVFVLETNDSASQELSQANQNLQNSQSEIDKICDEIDKKYPELKIRELKVIDTEFLGLKKIKESQDEYMSRFNDIIDNKISDDLKDKYLEAVKKSDVAQEQSRSIINKELEEFEKRKAENPDSDEVYAPIDAPMLTDEQTNKLLTEQKASITSGDNADCRIAEMQKRYQATCYSCKIILTLITSFMNACGKVYDLTREAGSKILVIGSMLWLAAFALKLVSSFTNQEPMQIVNTLFIFMFKVAAAYIVINAGIGAIINLFVNPLLGAGADYGLGLLQAANQGLITIPTSSSFPYQGTEVIDSNVINKLMALAEGIDKAVSTNLVIGHALTCHSFHAGQINIFDPKEALGVPITLRIPDVWVWLCGAAIWFSGFMLTLGVGYYLLDVCFKIGFCIIALPIVIGLWPFGPTSGKFKACMSIIFRSAALFAFLALVVSYALSLISASLGDLTTFYAKINAGDAEWVSNMFSIFSASFIIILFAYLYSIKLVGTATDYTGKFFGDSVFGNASPIHHKATQMTDFVKKKAMQPVQYAGGVVAHQATRAVGAVAAAPINYVKNKFNKAKKSSKEDSKEQDKK